MPQQGDNRRTTMCLRRTKEMGWCMLDEGHMGECRGISRVETPTPAAELFDPRRKR